MNRKALFFDVDGTLLSEMTHEVPKSAIEALKKARAKGHLVFINSGRVYPHLAEIRRMVEADGCLCGCGTYVVAEDKVLYSHKIPMEQGMQIKEAVDRHRVSVVLESAEGCYMQDPPDPDGAARKFREDLIRDGVLVSKTWSANDYCFDKFCFLVRPDSDKDGFVNSLKDIQIIDRGKGFYECVPAGHSKATAIDIILNHYGLKLEDAYVFGDSTNDLPMFEYAKNAIVMGKHDKELEPHASFVTRTVEEDGVAYAMEALGLIS